MGVGIMLVNSDVDFSQLKIPPIIINDVVNSSIEEKTKLNNNILTTYTSDLLSNVPTCECGRVTGEYNVGMICTSCMQPVKHQHGDLESFVWLRAPAGVAALINPTVWMILTRYFSKGSFSLIHYLTDDLYKWEVKDPEFLPIVKSHGFQRSLNYFVENFDKIMDVLMNMKAFKKTVADSYLAEFIQKYRDLIFVQYLPLPNKTLLILEDNNSGRYMDTNHLGALDSIFNLVGIDSPLKNFSTKQKERRTIHCIDTLAEFYSEYYKTTLAKKEGIFRKHIFGGRSHFTIRAVISSITDPHQYDEIQIPWDIGINVLKLHITNKLMRGKFNEQGEMIRPPMNPNQINGFLNAHAHRYSPILDDVFKELIREAPDRGIDCVLNRNPSLMRGSCQALKITGIKSNVDDPTIGMSILICKSFNADFDGDALNAILTIDNKMARAMQNLAPHKNSFSLDDHRGISSSQTLPKPLVSTIANWLDTDD